MSTASRASLAWTARASRASCVSAAAREKRLRTGRQATPPPLAAYGCGGGGGAWRRLGGLQPGVEQRVAWRPALQPVQNAGDWQRRRPGPGEAVVDRQRQQERHAHRGGKAGRGADEPEYREPLQRVRLLHTVGMAP